MTVPDAGVPTTEVPDDDPIVELPEEARPPSGVPQTGDSVLAWTMAAAVSGLGLGRVKNWTC